jgi:redox-sensitive bicupin YhaK (pirin superfamily)
MDPRYQEIKQPEIPTLKTPDGAAVRIISGELGGVQGPVRHIVADQEFLDVSLPAGKSFTHKVAQGHTTFAYIIEGKGTFGERLEHRPGMVDNQEESYHCESDTLVLYGKGDTIHISTDSDPTRFLLVSGRPLGEAVA